MIETVLGLLGPAGSGKDLVADWLQEKGFAKVAFADPMKRFAYKTFGFTVEQLWGPSPKRNQSIGVDDAWWMEAIGHIGEASGEIVNNVLQTGDRVQGYLKLHDWFSDLRKNNPISISPRVVLQTLGTEWGRNVDPELWVRYAYETIDILKRDHAFQYDQLHGIVDSTSVQTMKSYTGVVIPDHRFINEVEQSQAKGSYVLRLRRLSQESVPAVGVEGHQSEAEQKTIPDSAFDAVLNFEEGIDKVYAVLETVFKRKSWETKRMNPS